MKSKPKLSSFFINLLGVILGITLTFGVNSLWQKREEKRKIREMLILVRNELETNKSWFQKQEKSLKLHSYAFNKILEADKNWSTIPDDTLISYLSFTEIRIYQFQNSAWEIFQSSEMIQKITNKELVVRLNDCYFEMNMLYDFIMKNYWDRKLESIPIFENDLYSFLDALIDKKESFYFLGVMNEDSNLWNIFPQVDAGIDFTISLLDKYGDFKYDMIEMDEEYSTFVKARIDSVLQKKDTLTIKQ